MDLESISEFHCSVCSEVFGKTLKCPRMLGCGHSFCHSCLEILLVHSPACPNCKQGIQFPYAECIPINYAVLSFVSRFNVNTSLSLKEQDKVPNSSVKGDLKEDSKDSLPLEKELSSLELPYEGFCEDHHIYKNFRCMDCKCWVCGVCVVLSHKCCQTLLVEEALKEMKREISQEIDAEVEIQNSQNKNLDKFLKYFKEKESPLKKEICDLQLDLTNKTVEKLQSLKSDRKKHCEKFKLLEASVKETSNYNQFTKAKNKLFEYLVLVQKLQEELTIPRHSHCLISLEILKDWCQEGSVYATRSQNGSNQYGKVVVKGDRLWVYCFKNQRPQRKNIIISFRELLTTFNASSGLPSRGFFQVTDGTSAVSDVVIATDALTPRAINFLLLCSGTKGRSYKGKSLKSFLWSIRTVLEGGGFVVKGIRDGGVYEAPVKKGFVWGLEAKATDYISNFAISMEDEPKGKLRTKFGFVEEGFEVCERIYNYKIIYGRDIDVVVNRCGLVI